MAARPLSHAHARLWYGWPGAALVQAAPFCSAAGRVLQVSGVALAQRSPRFSGRGCALDAVLNAGARMLVCIASMAMVQLSWLQEGWEARLALRADRSLHA